MDEIYEKLCKKLDSLSVGFPSTESKIEVKILKRLFTEEEAELFINVSPFLETSEDVAKRLNQDKQKISLLMEHMAKKGLLFRQRKENSVRFAAIPYVVGIFEFQVKSMNKEFVDDNDKFFEEGFGKAMHAFKTPVLRTIPINKEIAVNWPIAPYDDVLHIIENQKVIAVAPCICRTMSKTTYKGCGKPIEACFVFGSHANYYVENNMARFITKEEAKQILKNNEKAGLVMQPFNSQHVSGMCSCCGCCCGMLRSLKKQPVPSESVKSNYFAIVESKDCTGCETCIERCQMEAIEMVDSIANIKGKRCIGCGLCVTTCPSDAIKLVKKSQEEQYLPPQSGAETYIQIATERGKNPLA